MGVGVGVGEVVQGVDVAGLTDETKVVERSADEVAGWSTVEEEALESPVEDATGYTVEVDSAECLPVEETADEDFAVGKSSV